MERCDLRSAKRGTSLAGRGDVSLRTRCMQIDFYLTERPIKILNYLAGASKAPASCETVRSHVRYRIAPLDHSARSIPLRSLSSLAIKPIVFPMKLKMNGNAGTRVRALLLSSPPISILIRRSRSGLARVSKRITLHTNRR
jgi:hypothetical protein